MTLWSDEPDVSNINFESNLLMSPVLPWSCLEYLEAINGTCNTDAPDDDSALQKAEQSLSSISWQVVKEDHCGATSSIEKTQPIKRLVGHWVVQS